MTNLTKTQKKQKQDRDFNMGYNFICLVNKHEYCLGFNCQCFCHKEEPSL